MKSPGLAVLAPDYEHRVIAHVEHGTLTGPGQLGGMGNEQPGRPPDPLELEAKDVWVEVQGPLQGEAPGLAGQQLQGRGRGCAGAHRSARHQSVQRVLRYGR